MITLHSRLAGFTTRFLCYDIELQLAKWNLNILASYFL